MMRKLPTRHYSKQQESAVAKTLGGKTIANSGATAFDKGDIKTDSFLIECKTKVKPSDSIKINKDWIEKHRNDMMGMGKSQWALAFNFGPEQENFYIVDERLFKRIVDMIEGDDIG